MLPADSVAAARSAADHQNTEAQERALIALVSIGDRCAMEALYNRYFMRLAKFLENLTLRSDLVEELINDTMFEVLSAGATICTNTSVFVAIMRVAYFQVERYFAAATVDERNSRREVQERGVLQLVYASGCSRRETADVLGIPCDRVDAVLHDVRANWKRYYRVSSTHRSGKL